MRMVSWRDRLRPELRELRAYQVPPHQPIKLDANENPHRLSEAARSELARELAKVDLNRYPDPKATRLREVVAESLGVDSDQLLFGCGVDEVIALLCACFAQPAEGRTQAAVLYPWPSFVMFRITSRTHGLRTIEAPLDERFQLPVEGTLALIEQEDPGLLFLPSPNNPTGNRLAPEAMRAILESTPSSLTVIDEAYYDFCGATLLPLLAAHGNMAVFRTLSKMGLAGLRVGALIGRSELIAEIDKARQPYNLNALSQRAAELALTRFKDELAEQARRVIADRETLARALDGLAGVTVFPSDANFLLVRFDTSATSVWEQLRAKGILVRNFDYPGPLAGCLRITVGTSEENHQLVDSLQSILASQR